VKVSGLTAVAAQFVGSKPVPNPPATAVAPGTYTGQNSQNGNGVRFFVAAGGKSVVNFSIPVVNLGCLPGGGAGDHILILQTAVRPDGSFTATASQDGIARGARARFTYSVAGRFERATASAEASAAGSYRVDIAFPDSATSRCTSNNQTWRATRSAQPAQQGAIVAGAYRGQNSQNGNGVSFTVAAGGRSLTNFSIPVVNLGCLPGGGAGEHILILQTAIRPDGSFTATGSQDGLVRGARARITYTVTGHFEGVTSSGPGAAGSHRVDVVFPDSPSSTCTSNDQFWRVTGR
jgi:hypothetical protein